MSNIDYDSILITKEDGYENTTFLMSLDEIDLNFLSIENIKQRNSLNITPLWSKSNLSRRNQEYYEFSMMASKASVADEVCESNSENIEVINDNTQDTVTVSTYTCHICNLEVPKVYAKEHNKSAKHKIYVKIADQALERIKKHMTQEIDLNEMSPQTKFTYYCEHCVASVRQNDKTEHENSNAHKMLLMQDKLFNDIINNLYVNKNENVLKVKTKPNVIDEKIATKSDIHKNELNNIKNDNKKKKVNVIDEQLTTKSENNESKKNDNQKKVTKKVTNNTDKALVPIKSDLTTYIKAISDTKESQKTHSLTVLNENYIEIEALNGSKMKVPMNDYHGYFDMEDTIGCRVCYEQLRLEHSEVEKHKYTKTHIDRIMTPIKDAHCIRQLNKQWSHCILCNQLIKNNEVQNHQLYNITHSFRLKASLIASNKSIVANVKDKAEVKTLPGLLDNVGSAVNKAQSVSTKVEKNYQMEETERPSELMCRICKTKVPNKRENVDEHIKGLRHNNNYVLMLKINELKKISDTHIFCEVCNLNVTITSEIDHVNSEKHKINLKEPQSAVEDLPSTSNSSCNLWEATISEVSDTYCDTCQVNVGRGNMAAHVAGRQHKSIVKNVVEHKSVVKNVEENKNVVKYELKDENYHFCDVCQVKVPKHPSNIKMHNKGGPHNRNWDKLLAESRN